MHRLWTPIIEPIVEALAPRTIVEVGANQGRNTRNLLEYAREHDATVHVIDPEPDLDIDEWRAEWVGILEWHSAPSLEVLGTIDSPDLVLIDGDHNWYTVINELRLIDEIAGEHFPLVLLHDVGWPYGRRDLYYVPDRIPSEFRHEHAQAGMWPDRDELDEHGGLNRGLSNATLAGGPRNGVLTAVEDFMAESNRGLELLRLPLVHGLGILSDRDLVSHSADAAAIIKSLGSPSRVTELLSTAESLRLTSAIEAYESERAVNEAWGEIERLRADLARERKDAAARSAAERERDRAHAAAARSSEAARVADERLEALRRRRSVRAALVLARLARPVVAMARAARRRLRRDGSGSGT